MAADESRTSIGPRDSTYVGVSDPAELKFWAERFDTTPEQLRRAVAEAGHKFDDVEYYLHARKRRRSAE